MNRTNPDAASVKPASTSPAYYLLSRREKYVWGLKPSPRAIDEVFPYTFRAIRERLGLPEAGDRSQKTGILQGCRSDDSDLCHDMLSVYGFSQEQMHRAAERFRLGRSKSGKTIYWMIDDLGRWLDGHIGDSWVSTMLKARYPEAAPFVSIEHCLFGLHQISQYEQMPIGIVESERTAVLLSELRPELLWLAYVYGANCTVDQFEPLQGRKITFFPRTDPDKEMELSFLELADQLKRLYRHIDVNVSHFLEDHASPDQKARHIDLIDFLFEST